MKKNGFTLIELLAVIVVLAIIALIATPVVLNIINNAKTSSNERSGELYVKAVENAIMKKQLNGTDVVTSGTYTVQSDGSICIVSNNTCTEGTIITIDVEGDVPTEGTITVSNGVVVSYNLVVSGTSVTKVESSDEDEDSNTLSCLVGDLDGVPIYFVENNNKVYFNYDGTWSYSILEQILSGDESYSNELDTFKNNIENFDETKNISIYYGVGSFAMYNYDNTWYYIDGEEAPVEFTEGTIDKSIVESSIEFNPYIYSS